MDYYKVKERAENLLTPAIEALGYEVVEIDCKYINKADTITVYIYKEGGVSLEDCIRVSEGLDALLESEDITGGAAYAFNVSSPGLDRPIVSDKDFRRALNTVVETESAEGKKKKTVGTLIAYDEETFILLVKTVKQTFRRADAKLFPYIDFGKLKEKI